LNLGSGSVMVESATNAVEPVIEKMTSQPGLRNTVDLPGYDPMATPSKKMQEELFELFKKHPWYWLSSGLIYTRDDNEEDDSKAIKKFPHELAYLKIATHIWVQYNMTLWQKSRQLLMSYLFSFLYDWQACFKTSRTTHLISRNAEDSQYQLMRIKWMHEMLPEWVTERLPHVEFLEKSIQYWHYKPNDKKLKRPHVQDSLIRAMSEDSSAPRSRTPSGTFADEMAHLKPTRCTKLVRAALPSLQKGAKFTGVTSVNERGDWFRLFYSLKVGQHDVPKKLYRHRLRKGMSIFKNNRGWYCIELHHTADPNKQKDSPWYKRERKKYSEEDWAQEMDMSTLPVHDKGVAYFNVFQKSMHVTEETFDTEDVAALVRGWDFGFGFPVCLFVLWLTDGSLYCFDELRGKNEVTQRYAMRVFAQTNLSMTYVLPDYSPNNPLPTNVVYDWGDAEGKQTDSTSGTTDIDTIYDNFKVNIIPVGGVLAERLKSINDRLIMLIDDKPSLRIHPRCKILIEGLHAGYRSRDDGRVLKDGLYDHYIDALSCLTMGVERQGHAPQGFDPYAQQIEQGMDVGQEVGGYRFD